MSTRRAQVKLRDRERLADGFPAESTAAALHSTAQYCAVRTCECAGTRVQQQQLSDQERQSALEGLEHENLGVREQLAKAREECRCAVQHVAMQCSTVGTESSLPRRAVEECRGDYPSSRMSHACCACVRVRECARKKGKAGVSGTALDGCAQHVALPMLPNARWNIKSPMETARARRYHRDKADQLRKQLLEQKAELELSKSAYSREYAENDETRAVPTVSRPHPTVALAWL